MSARLHLAVLAICCLAFAVPAVAQLDSSALRAKYGLPLYRETFHIPSGFDLIVDYGASHQVCKLELPALMPTNEKISNASEMTKRMHDFLAELVPPSLRGKELGHVMEAMSAVSVLSVEYEHVTIRELQDANQPFGNNNTITVTFKSDNCQRPTGH
jgi:hypothetical protein